MRKSLVTLILLVVAAFWVGCGQSNTNNMNPRTDTTDNAEKIIKEKQQADNAAASNANRTPK